MMYLLPAVLFWGIPLAYILFRGFRSPDQKFLGPWTRAYGIEDRKSVE